MRKKQLLIFVFLLAFVLTSSACGSKKGVDDKRDGGGSTKVVNEKKKVSEDDMAFSGSMKDLLNKKQKEICTFSGTDEDMTFEGVTYIGTKRVRQDIKMVSEGEEMDVTMLMDGDDMYTWSSMSPGQGSKMSIEAMESGLEDFDMPGEFEDEFDSESENDAMTEKDGQDFEKVNDYKCKSWKVDDKLLTVPSDIEFIDYDQVMKEMHTEMEGMQGLDGMTADMRERACAMCDMAPDPSECRKDSGCE